MLYIDSEIGQLLQLCIFITQTSLHKESYMVLDDCYSATKRILFWMPMPPEANVCTRKLRQLQEHGISTLFQLHAWSRLAALRSRKVGIHKRKIKFVCR